jgi:hypothetical protein
MSLWGKLRSAFGGSEEAAEASKPAESSKPPTPQELFSAEVEAAIRARFPKATVKKHPEVFGFLVDRGQGEQRVFLDNVFGESRDDAPETRRGRIAQFVASLETPDTSKMTWDEIRPRLVPLLRAPSMFSNVTVTREKLPITRPFVPFVIECVGFDSEHSMAYVTPGMAEAWGVQVDDIFAAATETGRTNFVADLERYDPDAEYPIWFVARNDSYESSRLAIPGWLASFAGKVKGRPIAIVPRRDLLIVGGDGNEQCVRRLLNTAHAEFEGAPRRISPALYTVNEKGAVVPLNLDPTHPLASEVAVAHVKAAIAEYETQKEPLQNRLGEGVFVASCNGRKEDDGRVYTYAVWSKDVPTLLPRTDLVMLLTEPGVKGGEVIRVAWEKLAEVFGDCMIEEPGLDPPRWRTLTWPTDAMLSRVRASQEA